ncbi:MAG TPA: hypothetical protein VLZ29_04465 [Sulfurimonas sp.]|uniref:hypothetical protein n=1 Tax=Sulfurimonas sp. TaxID=2022749 RepID=UPI002C5E6CF9|nr:hypothetical protein [Sulfurimonas sp.]HUH42344.1 hypothetical protein [Sulfurimonas sp.]
MTTIKSKPTTFFEKVFIAHRKFENFTHIGFLYAAIAIVPIGAFLLAAQLNFANHRYEVDLTALPVAKQERFNYLEKQELELWRDEGVLQRDYNFAGAKFVSEQRTPILKEMRAILAEAPYSSWGYKLFNTFGLVDNKNKKIAAMRKG